MRRETPGAGVIRLNHRSRPVRRQHAAASGQEDGSLMKTRCLRHCFEARQSMLEVDESCDFVAGAGAGAVVVGVVVVGAVGVVAAVVGVVVVDAAEDARSGSGYPAQFETP